jgi:hypothetical protein
MVVVTGPITVTYQGHDLEPEGILGYSETVTVSVSMGKIAKNLIMNHRKTVQSRWK